MDIFSSVLDNGFPFIVSLDDNSARAGWTGDFSANSPDFRISVDSPKVLTAKWRTDYAQSIVLLIVVGAVGVFIIRRKGDWERKRSTRPNKKF